MEDVRETAELILSQRVLEIREQDGWLVLYFENGIQLHVAMPVIVVHPRKQ